MNKWILVVLPVLLLAGAIGLFQTHESFLEINNAPPVEELFIQRVIFAPDTIQTVFLNDGPEPVTLAQVLIDDVYWEFTSDKTTYKPRERGKVDLAYPWVEGDPLKITLLTSTGATFEAEIDAVVETPAPSVKRAWPFVLLGLYVGVIPVLLGLLWFPVLRNLKKSSYLFLLSLTVGLLVFLAVDGLVEAVELLPQVPHLFHGTSLILIGFLGAVLLLGSLEVKQNNVLAWGYLIALGIGLHNLGEGLMIGSAYAIGEASFGMLLVVGFMIHNLTEGVAIVSPLLKTKKKLLKHLIFMGLLGGVPTIFGTLVGGFSYSATLTVLFLAIGAGAISHVVQQLIKYLAKERLFTAHNVLGFLAGLLIMYGTSFLVV